MLKSRFSFFNIPTLMEQQLKTLKVDTKFGKFVFQSNKLTDEKIKEYQEKFEKVQSSEEFNVLYNDIQKEYNIFSQFNNDFDIFAEKLLRSPFETLFGSSPLKEQVKLSNKLDTTESIDKEIERLQNLRKELEVNKQKEELENQKNNIRKQIQDLNNELSIKSKTLIDNLGNELMRNQINQEMIDIHNKTKELENQLQQLNN